MFNKFKRVITMLLTVALLMNTTVNVFAINNLEMSTKELKNQLQEEYPYVEIVGQKSTQFGQVYYVDKDYYEEKDLRARAIAPWDVVDIVMALDSWRGFISSPSLSGFGWAILDSAAVLPYLPSTSYVRKGGKYIIKTSALKNFAKTEKGLSIITKALRVERKFGKLDEVRKIAQKYVLSNKRYVDHILDLHGPLSTAANKSKFSVVFDIQKGIKDTLRGADSIIKPNTGERAGYIFEKTYDCIIGYSSNGKPCKTLKVVIDEVGNVITSYPIK